MRRGIVTMAAAQLVALLHLTARATAAAPPYAGRRVVKTLVERAALETYLADTHDVWRARRVTENGSAIEIELMVSHDDPGYGTAEVVVPDVQVCRAAEAHTCMRLCNASFLVASVAIKKKTRRVLCIDLDLTLN